MIYTVTLNPSIDYVVTVLDFQNGGLNRTNREAFLAGGKGNNVSVVLNHLGVKSTTLGFVAGFTGDKIVSMLQEKGICTEFIRLPKGNSRVNIKMHSLSDNAETEINGSGPDISAEHLQELFGKLRGIKEGDTLILAGSIPPSVPDTIYEDICAMLSGKNIRLIVDAEKRLLDKVIKYKPFLLKPNHRELGEMFHTTIRTKADALFYAQKLCEMGAQQVIVSMAGDGAVFVGRTGEVYEMDAPKGRVINSVGSGDSMIAGFLAALEGAGADTKTAFEMSVCAGSACAFMQGLPNRCDVEAVMGGIGKEGKL